MMEPQPLQWNDGFYKGIWNPEHIQATREEVEAAVQWLKANDIDKYTLNEVFELKKSGTKLIIATEKDLLKAFGLVGE